MSCGFKHLHLSWSAVTCHRFGLSGYRVLCMVAPGSRPDKALTGQRTPNVLPSSQQINKQRRANQRGDRAHRQFARRNDGARERVGNHHKNRAANCRSRQSDPVVTSQRKPNEMWHDESDITNRATRRHRTSHQQTRHNKNHQPHTRDLDPKIESVAFSQHQ